MRTAGPRICLEWREAWNICSCEWLFVKIRPYRTASVASGIKRRWTASVASGIRALASYNWRLPYLIIQESNPLTRSLTLAVL